MTLRTLFIGLGALAAGALAVSLASTSAASADAGCRAGASCCNEDAACCPKADPTITCPMTGEKIKSSECPLCQCRK